MNIVFFTNTYTPHVGGVARSVTAFSNEYRKRGHNVLIVAPEFADSPKDEKDVIRVPAIQNFNASDFSVAIPIPTGLTEVLEEFSADIIHSHHPFLLGMTAIRLARYLGLPLVFTHHTLYEQYTHYVPGDSDAMKVFVIELATHYANMCDQVFAPSESIRELIKARGTESSVDVIPTGVNIRNFSKGRRKPFRKKYKLNDEAFVIGHMGRLAPEKNLPFLAKAVIDVMQENPDVYFLLVGTGTLENDIKKLFSEAGLDKRLIMMGILQDQQLADSLSAMDVFAFASKSETQGMVLTEAMAAGLPVVALDASGVREVVKDRVNGRLIHDESTPAFGEALSFIRDLNTASRKKYVSAAKLTAKEFSMENSAKKALSIYQSLSPQRHEDFTDKEISWEHMAARIKAEWDILMSVTRAGEEAIESLLDKENQ